MSVDKPKPLLELLRRDKQCAKTLAGPLAELALEQPVHASEATEALTTSLKWVTDYSAQPEPLTNAIVKVIPAYPKTTDQLVEPLTRMTAHEEPAIRKEGYRCVGCLGALTRADSFYLADLLTEGIVDDEPVVRKAALWGLTKVGLTAPDAISGARSTLVETLTDRPKIASTTNQSHTIRRYAAEALAVMATGNLETDNYAPAQPSIEISQLPNAAAWAIQNSVSGRHLPLDDREQALHETDITQDHRIALGLYEHLSDYVEVGGDHASVVAATVALGYLAPGQEDMHGGLKLLNSLVENEDTQRSRAAQAVFDHGPINPVYPEPTDQRDETSRELTVKSREPVQKPGNIAGVPYELKNTFGVESGTVLRLGIEGHNRTIAQARILHQNEGIVTVSSELRQNLGVNQGDTVVVEHVKPQPARKVTLALPAEAPFNAKEVPLERLRQALTSQSFTDGDILAMTILTDIQSTVELLDNDASIQRFRSEFEELQGKLPLRVVDVKPETANEISSDTVLEVTSKQDTKLGSPLSINNLEIPALFPYTTLKQAILSNNSDRVEELRRQYRLEVSSGIHERE